MTIGKEFLKIKSKNFKQQDFVKDKILSSSRILFVKKYKEMYVSIMPVIMSGISKEDIVTTITIGKLIPEVYMHSGRFEPLIRAY